MKRKVLFIGPLPDPITGQSLACEVFLRRLRQDYAVDVIDIGKKQLRNGLTPLSRTWILLALIVTIWRKMRSADVIYFTIAESFWGNLKDLVILLVCLPKLRHAAIHLHGGAGMRKILASRGLVYRMNVCLLRRLGAIIVLGDTHLHMYHRIVPGDRLRVVPNFAEDDLFVQEDCILQKFRNTTPLRVLFLSNHLEGKGHIELLEAFSSLTPERRAQIRLDFAGGFESDADRRDFLRAASAFPGVHHHGTVSGLLKRELLSGAHLFCLPTYYAYEGQPISILEAYAAGCAVLTTNHSGIADIFSPERNGYLVAPASSGSVREAIEHALRHPAELRGFALANRRLATEKHRVDRYNADLMATVAALLESAGAGRGARLSARAVAAADGVGA